MKNADFIRMPFCPAAGGYIAGFWEETKKCGIFKGIRLQIAICTEKEYDTSL